MNKIIFLKPIQIFSYGISNDSLCIMRKGLNISRMWSLCLAEDNVNSNFMKKIIILHICQMNMISNLFLHMCSINMISKLILHMCRINMIFKLILQISKLILHMCRINMISKLISHMCRINIDLYIYLE